MNVTFHTLGAITTAAVLNLAPDEKWHSFRAAKKYAIGFVAGILLHGLLDYLPHNYPLNSKIDVLLALFLFFLALALTQRQNLILMAVCFAGCLLPDVVDLGPALANKYLGFQVPQLPVKIFPWHWKENSGSIYDGSRFLESTLYHFLFSMTCCVLIYFYREKFFRNYSPQK